MNKKNSNNKRLVSGGHRVTAQAMISMLLLASLSFSPLAQADYVDPCAGTFVFRWGSVYCDTGGEGGSSSSGGGGGSSGGGGSTSYPTSCTLTEGECYIRCPTKHEALTKDIYLEVSASKTGGGTGYFATAIRSHHSDGSLCARPIQASDTTADGSRKYSGMWLDEDHYGDYLVCKIYTQDSSITGSGRCSLNIF